MQRSTIQKGVRHLQKVDPKMAFVVKKAGPITLRMHRDAFVKLAGSIVSQQLSTKAAATIWNRLVALFPGEKKLKPELVLKASDQKLRSAGVSFAKVASLKDLAQKCLDGTITTRKLSKLDSEEAIELLTTVRGIGQWTAEMYLIFAMGKPDVFPCDDAGIQRGVKEIYGFKAKPTRAQMERIAQLWSPYASVGSVYVWHYLDTKRQQTK